MLSSWLVLSTLLVGILILPDSVEQSGLNGQSHEWYKLLVSPLPFFQRLLIVLGSCYEKCKNIFHWWYRVTSSSTAARTMVLNAERRVMYLVITQAIMLQLAELINKVSWRFASTIVFSSNKGHTLIVLPSSNSWVKITWNYHNVCILSHIWKEWARSAVARTNIVPLQLRKDWLILAKNLVKDWDQTCLWSVLTLMLLHGPDFWLLKVHHEHWWQSSEVVVWK